MAKFRLKLNKDNPNCNFMGVHKFTFCLSFFMTVAMVVLLFTKGLNLGIDFTGGVLMEIRPPAGMTLVDMRDKLHSLSTGAPSIQEFGKEDILVKIPGREADMKQQQALQKEVQGLLGKDAEFRRVEYVGPQVGNELIKAGVTAFIYSMLAMLAYVWIRFEWQFGVVIVFALAHDVFATILFFLITQIEFDLATVAAALLIAGYSINETVVVFDRIREMMRKYRKKPMPEVVNISINDVLSRTLMTCFTTLAALTGLCIFGGEVIKGFTYAMLVGITFGPYSSMFFSAPLLTYLNLRANEKADKEEAEKKTEGELASQRG